MNLHRWLKEPWDYVLTATRITQHAEVKSDGMKSIMPLQKKIILTEGQTLSVHGESLGIAGRLKLS